MNTEHTTITEDERSALSILRDLRIGPIAAAILARELLRIGRGSEKRARRCLSLGEAALRSHEKTVSFSHAVQAALDSRHDRRPRTLKDIRYLAKRLMRLCPGLAERRMRSITAADCSAYLQQAFATPRQRTKAHAVLSTIFRTAVQQGWCSRNPMLDIEKPRIREKEIPILTGAEIHRLLHTAATYKRGICLPAVALMLYAGLRPHEVMRLTWADINLTHNSIRIQPRHSKTGGARRVTIHPPLHRILSSAIREPHTPICPPAWAQHWRRLHKLAGFDSWQPDILRHTFASHHLAHFRSYSALQFEMGHRSADLLRTRYVSMPCETELIFCPPNDRAYDSCITAFSLLGK